MRAGIERRYLTRMRLPVGGCHKSDLRAMAADVGLRVAEKKDSQEICFVTSGKHADFVRQRSDETRAGEIVTSDGQIVGKHLGIEGFTIGQRKGVGVAMHEPYFVIAIEPQTNRVVIGRKAELGRTSLLATDANWLCDVPIGESFSAEVQIRYNSSPRLATVKLNQEKTFEVQFDQPVEGVAPGQLAVVFRENRVLGGGWIEKADH